MKDRFYITAWFAGLGAFSGICCNFTSIAFPGTGLFTTGLFFGIVIAVALHRTVQPLGPLRVIGILLAMEASFWFAFITALLSIRFGVSNGLTGSFTSGAMAGSVGSLVAALTLYGIVRNLRSIGTVVSITFAGSVLGGISVLISVYIADHTTAGPPWNKMILLPLWQSGVAATIPIFAKKPAEEAGGSTA